MRKLKSLQDRCQDDLVTTILRAIELAESSGSHTTVYLLKMVLLNEGVRLADDLSRKHSSVGKRPNRGRHLALPGATARQRPTPILPPGRRAGARPRQSPAADGSHGVCETPLSGEGPARLARSMEEPASRAVLTFLTSFKPRD